MVVVLYVMISVVYMSRVSSLYFCKIMPSSSFATSEITPEIGELTVMLKFLFNIRWQGLSANVQNVPSTLCKVIIQTPLTL